MLLTALVCIGCKPKHAAPALISDGTIILLRNGLTNAAVVVSKQTTSPEILNYTWFLRLDGNTTFAGTNPALRTGTVTGATSIAVGPFMIHWSTAGNAGGYIYYPEHTRYVWMPWGKYYAMRLPGGPELAVTTEREIAKVDANDPRWRFLR